MKDLYEQPLVQVVEMELHEGIAVSGSFGEDEA